MMSDENSRTEPANRYQEARERAGLTRVQALKILGFPTDHIERGAEEPSAARLAAMASAYGVTECWLSGHDTTPERCEVHGAAMNEDIDDAAALKEEHLAELRGLIESSMRDALASTPRDLRSEAGRLLDAHLARLAMTTGEMKSPEVQCEMGADGAIVVSIEAPPLLVEQHFDAIRASDQDELFARHRGVLKLDFDTADEPDEGPPDAILLDDETSVLIRGAPLSAEERESISWWVKAQVLPDLPPSAFAKSTLSDVGSAPAVDSAQVIDDPIREESPADVERLKKWYRDLFPGPIVGAFDAYVERTERLLAGSNQSDSSASRILGERVEFVVIDEPHEISSQIPREPRAATSADIPEMLAQFSFPLTVGPADETFGPWAKEHLVRHLRRSIEGAVLTQAEEDAEYVPISMPRSEWLQLAWDENATVEFRLDDRESARLRPLYDAAVAAAEICDTDNLWEVLARAWLAACHLPEQPSTEVLLAAWRRGTAIKLVPAGDVGVPADEFWCEGDRLRAQDALCGLFVAAAGALVARRDSCRS